MSKKIKFLFAMMLSTLFAVTSCKKEDKTFGDILAPDKPVIDVQVAGKTTALPYGDGTGKVTVNVTSANGINYKIDFGDGGNPVISTANSQSHTYSHIGSKELTISAIVSGKGGLASTSSVKVTVLKNYTPSAGLVTMLTNDATKTWKVDSMAVGHFGVGPVASFTSDYWSAPPNDKAGLGIYDDEYTFTKSSNTFAHKTNGSIFGKKEYLTDFDPSLTGSGDYTLTGPNAADYSEGFSYDGDNTQTTEYIIFTTKGHMGLYVGSQKFQVLTKSATQMWLRCLGKDGNAWYVKIKAK